jgi:hypothetical protein
MFIVSTLLLNSMQGSSKDIGCVLTPLYPPPGVNSFSANPSLNTTLWPATGSLPHLWPFIYEEDAESLGYQFMPKPIREGKELQKFQIHSQRQGKCF